MAEFDAWTEFYDLIHPGLPGEVEFYAGHGMRCEGRVLELGCGSGRVALPMVMAGVDVTGVDISAGMLDLCEQRAGLLGDMPGKLALVQGDMRDVSLDATFNLVICPYRGFMHLLTPEDAWSCMHNVRRHLAPSGQFIFSLWDARPSQIARLTGPGAGGLKLVERYALDEESASHLLHFQATRADELEQLLHEEHLFHLLDEQGMVVQTRSLGLTRAWYTQRELAHLFHACGFQVEALFGDFDCASVSEATREMIWVLSRAEDGPGSPLGGEE